MEGSEVILSDEYIEKIIQLPINIPDLSSKDIENYLLLLVAQMYMNQEKFSELLQMIQEKHLAIREEGIKLKELNEMIESIDSPFEKSTEEYLKDVEIINEIKDIISTNLKGNPRQTKRFLNTFVTKKELAQMYYGENINIRILAKILVLQKISPDLFSQLNEWNKEFTIYNEKFKTMYNAVLIDKTNSEDYIQWRTPSLMKWLKCDPQELDKIRLDKYFYLTREKLRTSILNVNNLSYEARDILEEMGNSSEATIEGIVDKLNTLQPESVDSVIEMILSQADDGKISMYVIKTIFVKCKSYRRKILMTLEKGAKKFELDDVPYFKTMLNEDETNVKELLNKLKGNTLTVSLYNKIFNIKV